jgi:hypothetical protein
VTQSIPGFKEHTQPKDKIEPAQSEIEPELSNSVEGQGVQPVESDAVPSDTAARDEVIDMPSGDDEPKLEENPPLEIFGIE